MTDIDTLKPRLKEYLNLKGIQITKETGADRIHCPHPDHPDKNKTAIYYADSQTIHCPVCATTWDIFEVAGLICNLYSFPEKINEVKKTLGIPIEKKKNKKYVAITYDEAKKIYTTEKLLSMCEYIGKKSNPKLSGKEAMLKAWGDTITGAWPYKNKDGLIDLIDVRFEGTGRKAVISFYYNSKNIKCAKSPILLYNRDKLFKDPSVPRLIHEGAKCAKIAEEAMSGFIHTTWNGGGAKAKYVDFTAIGNKAPVYIYPDDDQKTNNQGKIKPNIQQPGVKTALEVRRKLRQKFPDLKIVIVKPFEKARKIKPDGADIVEALQVASPEELSQYIFSSPGIENKNITKEENVINDDIPFRILGIADDGYAYYIDYAKRIFRVKLESLTKKSLQRIAPLSFWKREFQEGMNMTTSCWDEAVDWLIASTGPKDFDTDNILGRGAWKNKEGSFCYWDGKKLIGNSDPEKIFERKKQKDPGILDAPAGPELCKKIFSICEQMTFETRLDCMYFLSWCVLSLFSGVLIYRPPVLLTGDSGTGKSTIFEKLARPLSISFELTGSESTPAGCRQANKNNSEGIIIEEADPKNGDTKNREGFFSLMRVSFCENDPDAYKGTAGHTAITFRMKNMFMFISISPIVEGIADDDRLFVVNLIQNNNNWNKIKNQLKKLITIKNCRAIRARTWKYLHEIIDFSEEIALIIQKDFGISSRRSRAEGLMFSAYWYIWNGAEKKNLSEIKKIITEMYKQKPCKDIRVEAEELIERIMDESIMVNGYSNRMTIREIIQAVNSGRIKTGAQTDSEGEEILSSTQRQKFKNIAGRHGVSVVEGASLAIAHNHHMIMKIIALGKGYHRHFWRHKNCVEKNKPVYMAGITRRCVIIQGVIDDIPF